MVYRYLLMMLAIVAGIFLWPEDDIASAGAVIEREDSAQSIASNEDRYRTVVEDRGHTESPIQPSREILSSSVAKSAGKSLVEALDSFGNSANGVMIVNRY